jgi:hypothetical protein
LLLARFVSRSELGIFRLCQQLLMAADSPCWTFVQSKYPRMVEGGARFVEQVHGQIRTIALIVSGLCAGLSTALAFTFFATPPVAPLMTVLSLAILWRYKSYLFGQALRAAGHVGVVTGLAALRLAGALVLSTAAPPDTPVPPPYQGVRGRFRCAFAFCRRLSATATTTIRGSREWKPTSRTSNAPNPR